MSPKVTQTYTDEKIQGILDGAKRVFIRKGFYETTMQDIVEECGISRGGLYKYFSSTQEILTRILEAETEEDQDSLDPSVLGEADACDILEAFVNAESENILRIRQSLHPAAYEFFIRNMRDGQTMELLEKRHKAAMLAMGKVMEHGLQRGQIAGGVDTDAISRCVITFLEGLIITAIATNLQQEDLRRQVQAFNGMLRSALKR